MMLPPPSRLVRTALALFWAGFEFERRSCTAVSAVDAAVAVRCCLALLVLVVLLLLLSSLASSLPFPLVVRSVHWIGSVGFCALVLWVVHGPGSHGVPVVAWRGVKFCRSSRPWCGDGAAIGLHSGK
jgi:hypothetical protein